LTSTEQLIEAVDYAACDSIPWYHVFDSKTEAMKIINSAQKETPDEVQIACLLSAREADEDMFESRTAENTYYLELRKMKSELRRNV